MLRTTLRGSIRGGVPLLSPHIPASRRHISLHEYQGQRILSNYGVNVPSGKLTASPGEVQTAVASLNGRAVLKSQILAGNRGRGRFGNGLESGVHLVSSASEAEALAGRMLGHNLITGQTRPEGLPVSQIYVTEELDIAREYYLSLTIDREQFAPVLLMCEAGGSGIEEMAAQHPDKVVRLPLQFSKGITDDVVAAVCRQLGVAGLQERKELGALLKQLYHVFRDHDATLLEINPLVRTRAREGKGAGSSLVCADTKLTIDNAARARQGEIFGQRDFSQERAVELEAEKHGLVYVQLEGNIGCLVNGAGLAMATNDAVAHFGGRCANFLDGGGQATRETMVKAFELLLSDTNVNVILVNIYGGIIRCDMIAEAIVAAADHFKNVPVVVRLQGTNAKEGQEMIANSGLQLFAEPEFDGAVLKAIELANRQRGQETTKSRINPVTVGNNHGFSTLTSSGATRTKARAPVPTQARHRRGFGTAAFEPAAYSKTINNLAINSTTRVIYHGFTGQAATNNAKQTIAYGTNIVGGVSRTTKGGSGNTHHPDRELSSLPIYPTVRKAACALDPDATAIFVPAPFAASAIEQSIEAEIPLIVCVAEHIPVHDMLRVQEVLRTQSKSRLVGPNCPGIIAPLHGCRIGIMPHLQYAPGCVGIASKSGTLSYEAVASTTRAGLGQSLCVGVGGDLLPGTSLLDAVTVMVDDPATKAIVLLGEIGGDAEIQAAAFLKEYRARETTMGRVPKPVVGMITGLTAPKGRTMGHAGAISGHAGVTAQDKLKAMKEAGIATLVHPGEIGPALKALLP